MAELIHQFKEPIAATHGTKYLVQVWGNERDDRLWAGWLVFASLDGTEVLRTESETVQSSLATLTYWATGLEPVYLEGARARAKPVTRTAPAA